MTAPVSSPALTSRLFEHLLLVDVEATCWPSNAERVHEMEAIALGLALVRLADCATLHEAVIYVRPRVHPRLSEYCRTLTGISQATVDAGINFEQLPSELERHLQGYQGALAWASWGNYDRRQLEQDAKRWSVPTPLGALTHFNLKKLFAKRYRVKNSRPSTRRALAIAGLPYEGRPHSPADDVRNIARVLPLLVES